MKKSIVKVGEVYSSSIVDYTYDGLGIAKIYGFCVFIENTIIDEEVEFTITKVKKNLSFGKLNKIITKSPYRVTPKCSFYNECGACQLMHMSYEGQIEFKKNHVLKEINKFLNLDLDDISMILSSKKYRYRNKLVVPFSYKNNTCQRGLFKKGSHDIINNEDCLISNELSYKVVNKVYDYILEHSYFNNIRNVIVRDNFEGQLMIIIVSKTIINEDLVNLLIDNFSEIVSIVNNINDKDTNVILSNINHTLYGEDMYNDKLLDNTYKVSSRSFFQINRDQTEKLYSEAISFLSLENSNKVIDLYSGIGSIGLAVAKCVDKVLGIEIIEDAVNMANDNATLNNIENATFKSGKAEDLLEKYIKDYDTIIVDPPRKGLDNKLKDTLLKENVKRLVYISCNPSTLIRDIKDLGMTIKDITLCDMFINTYHIEVVVLLEKE